MRELTESGTGSRAVSPREAGPGGELDLHRLESLCLLWWRSDHAGDGPSHERNHDEPSESSFRIPRAGGVPARLDDGRPATCLRADSRIRGAADQLADQGNRGVQRNLLNVRS